MQAVILGKALDGGDLGTIAHHREDEAGVDAPPVDQHGAGTALAMIAALLGAGEVEMIPQEIEEGGPGRDMEFEAIAVDRHDDRHIALLQVSAAHQASPMECF
ncbi:hypothetical protein GCM10007276_27720 [Agaricicola taiwanensis]|uniref:Uncharacterized protein n=1 Tax=Agaricicola taiwanensis TaxID=591372 RepID=A0A8J3DXV8_9RHOB|nr:hypothetical protein GCM10007276_27720 [Agaricicola taiwanensis]